MLIYPTLVLFEVAVGALASLVLRVEFQALSEVVHRRLVFACIYVYIKICVCIGMSR